MFDAVWRGVDGIYGGYVVGRVVEAVQVVDGFSPLSVSVQFSGTVRAVESEWQIDVLHQGRATAAVGVELRQDTPKLTAIGKLGSGHTGIVLDTRIDTSQLEAPQTLPKYRFDGRNLRYEAFFDQRPIPSPNNNRDQLNEAWIRFDESVHEAPELGSHALCAVFLDALTPGLFFTSRPPKFVPTIDFSVHFAPGAELDRHAWHYVQQRTVWATEEFCVEESQLFNADGKLLAQGRQARRVIWEAN